MSSLRFPLRLLWWIASLAASVAALPIAAQVTIQINAGSGLTGNADALAAFNRAGQAWSSRLSGSYTIVINADLGSLGTGIIGSANSTILFDDYSSVRSNLVAATSGTSVASATAALPASQSGISFLAPTGSTWGSISGQNQVIATKANLKALGYSTSELDTVAGTTVDGSITFSSNFNFDYTRSDGTGAGLVDFETAAIHEIGHVLGFFSYVDSITPNNVFAPTVLDLFRFNSSNQPTSTTDLGLLSRDLRPGQPAVLSTGTQSWSMSTGLSHDGFQASHWKADDLTGMFIGMMDPSLATGTYYDPTAADFLALSLLGYNVTAIPEPAETVAIFAFAALIGTIVRRRRAARAAVTTS